MAIVQRVLALVVVPAQLLFLVGALVVGELQGSGYDPLRHDISDLGALTAPHAWWELGPEGVAGAATVAFSLVVLRPVVSWVGSVLLAASLMGLDSLSDLAFRLDCMAVERGCTNAARLASWQAQVHAGVGLLSSLASVAALLVIARRVRRSPGWEDLSRPTQWGAVALGVLLLAYAALEGRDGGGLVERVLVCALIPVFALLARRALRLGTPAPSGQG